MGRRRHSQDESPSMVDTFDGMKSNYEAARSSRFMRKRTGMMVTGSSADFHYRNVFDYLKIMEYARDMDRNDALFGPAIDRATLNTIQNGLTVDPQTPDKGLNAAVKTRFEDWADDKMQCDVSCQHNFTEFEEFVYRSSMVDGDDFILPLDSGQMQFVEAHRVRTPSGTKRNMSCGILLSDTRKPIEYWITKDDVDPWNPVALVGEVEKVPAFDAEGNPNVLHIWRGKRKSQSRGVSIAAAIFPLAGMFEDINFAELVKRQIASCFAIIREREANWKPGGIDPYGPAGSAPDLASLQRRICEEIAPGFEARGLPGEKISAFSPNIPGGDFFPHMRLVMQLFFINLGLPLVMGLMDASDTNFSGWRGAVDEARRGFIRNQGWLIERFHTPVYQWKLRQFCREDKGLRTAAAKLGKDFFRHKWNAPRWPYIQPLQDAQADQIQQQALLKSPRKIHNERGQDWNESTDETVADHGAVVRKAIKEAQAISKEFGVEVQWREVLFLTDPDMLKAVVKSGEIGGGGAGGAGGSGGQSKAAGASQPSAADSLQQFLQKVVLTLSQNAITAPIIANAMQIGMKGGVVDGAGAPINGPYNEPLLPVQVPPGQAQVSGAVVKDADGDVVGGAVLGGTAAPESQNADLEQQHEEKAAPAETTDGAKTPADGAENEKEKETGDETGKADPEGNKDPEDDTIDPEDKESGDA